MDNRRLIIFIIVSVGLMLGWEKLFPPKPAPVAVSANAATNVDTPSNTNVVSNSNIVDSSNVAPVAKEQAIDVKTDVLDLQLSTLGGDVREASLLKYGDYQDVNKPYKLMYQNDQRTFIAQTGLLGGNGKLPTHKNMFSSDATSYVLADNQDKLTVSLKSIPEAGDTSGVSVIKTYTFTRGSYVVNVAYQIVNNSDQALTNVSAYWRFLRDEEAPVGETKFAHTFTGPVYYNSDNKFNKIKFEDVNKNDLDVPATTKDGWIGFAEHYFTSLWVLNAYDYPEVCSNGVICHFNFKAVDDNKLASSGVLTDLPNIAPKTSYTIAVPMFVGPEQHSVISKVAPEVERTKDYGWVYIFATPLFWLLIHIFEFVKNWGLAIMGLTLAVKVALYPLTAHSYKSMARMKLMAPRLEELKKRFGDDKQGLQRAMMEMYKKEGVNPIGGCLPMILQIPVFIGLYWALLSSVELRQAHFLWIADLSRPDPYYILPTILGITMFAQTFLNPPAADPVQQKMMRIMPVAFSVMFFFFPAGLVVYWLVNNILSMAQQWYVNHHVVPKKFGHLMNK